MIHPRLPVTCCTDILFSNTKLRVGNKAEQVFCTADGWKRSLPMKKEKETHEALSLLSLDPWPLPRMLFGLKLAGGVHIGREVHVVFQGVTMINGVVIVPVDRALESWHEST
jgi:hypothetical protein